MEIAHRTKALASTQDNLSSIIGTHMRGVNWLLQVTHTWAYCSGTSTWNLFIYSLLYSCIYLFIWTQWGGQCQRPKPGACSPPKQSCPTSAHMECTPQDSCKGGPTENHKFTEDIMRLFFVCAVLWLGCVILSVNTADDNVMLDVKSLDGPERPSTKIFLKIY